MEPAESEDPMALLESEDPMESAESEDPSLPSFWVPRGGPLFFPNLVSPITRVPNFESSLLQLLQDLEIEISSGLADSCEEDISVEELKVFSEEELVDMAKKEAFKEDDEVSEVVGRKEVGSSARECVDGVTEEAPPGTIKKCTRKMRPRKCKALKDGKASDSSLQLVENQSNAGEDGSATSLVCVDQSTSEATLSAAPVAKAYKRKRNIENTRALVASYIAKIQEVVKIKLKQDEDKAKPSELHSLSAITNTVKGDTLSADRVSKLEIMRSTGSKVKLKPSDIQEHRPIQSPEVILSVEVYHHTRKSNKIQEFLVLGRQMLTELKDKIYCITDHIMEKAGLHDPSGYFLIEDVFCNDLRDPSAVDYSEPILEWLRNSKEEALAKWECIISGDLQRKQKAVVGEAPNLQLPRFKAVEMQKTRFSDLKFQLGAGYLYCHQGDCMHSIVIRDMRLLHPDDLMNRAAYPIVAFHHKSRPLKCDVCCIYLATRMTENDKWAPENPCYFCENCYFLLHYSKDMSLLYEDFSVYDYHHD